MDYFKYWFNESEWTIYLIDDDDTVIADEDAAAETRFEEKELYFRKSHGTLRVILHELWHVYFNHCYLSDTNNISLSDLEEITASLFSYKAESMIQTAKDIQIKLERLKKENNEKS